MIYSLLSKKKHRTTREIAKNRLKNALICDRIAISEEMLLSLKDDIVGVVSGYFEIDKDAFNMMIKKEEHPFSLVFNMPILSKKRN